MDERIKAWQEYLKSSPLGVSYTGPSDGVMNDQLKAALQSLETKLGTPLLSGDTIVADVGAAQSSPAQNATILEWKKYLQSKGLYTGDVNSDVQDDAFKAGMQALEELITKKVPTVSGMIWQNGKINPGASIPDVEEALKLLGDAEKKEDKPAKTSSLKFGVTNFDELGDPTAPDFIGTPFQQMFISQEDSKLDEWSPSRNQNQGTWQSDVPQKPEEKEEPKPQENSQNIDERMQALLELMGTVKKIPDSTTT
jgi:hypothetical protein